MAVEEVAVGEQGASTTCSFWLSQYQPVVGRERRSEHGPRLGGGDVVSSFANRRRSTVGGFIRLNRGATEWGI
jgi:hypothetical protein